ncbi:hypothetical protein PSTT_08947 [Puccinia striiformis]|uniref:Uncharacterized protein n=1 Tax=Puccinia striiformis TaxID=27350 RepID=A0A2S4VAF9_9BASI|nr:hypothetical protein PSTT_08947 [Puccinia striiformis]
MKRLMLAFLVGFMASWWVDPSVSDKSSQLTFEPENPASDSSPSPGRDHPNFIFASFAGLLQQWPNTFAYSGHSIIPGVVPRGTLLYHGTNQQTTPPTEATRAIRIIYLDGQSSSLGTPGFMDSQSVLINSTTVPEGFGDEGGYIKAEYERARELCRIGQERGFEGVVRMNTFFELLLCDFNQKVELLAGTNTTDPYDTLYQPGEVTGDSPSESSATSAQNQSDVAQSISPDEVPHQLQQAINDSNNSTIHAKNHRESARDEPQKSLLQLLVRPRPIKSPFFRRSSQYSFRASSRQFFMPGEVRVILDPSGFVSFYDRVESLSQKRQADGSSQSPRHTHRLFGISSGDMDKVKDRLFNVLARKNAEGWRTESDRLDWRATAWTIIQTYSNSLVELDYLLKRDDLTAIDRAAEVRDLTYGMLIPYVDFSSWMSVTQLGKIQTIKKCRRGFTAGTYRASELTESLTVIIGAIEGTLDRLCSTVLSIFSKTIKLSIPIHSSNSSNSKWERVAQWRTSEWRQQTEELMRWLGWSTWGHCDPPCKSDEMCLPPLWPLYWIKGLPQD